MNRVWISSLSLAGVVGSGGAAWATLAEPGDASPPSDVAGTTIVPVVSAADVPAAATTISYQVGAAGIVTVDLAANGATVTAVSPGVGWTVGSVSAAGTHLEVVFTDAAQIVTFSADLVGGVLVPSVSAVAQPGAPAPAPVAVTEIAAPAAIAPHATPAPAPAPAPVAVPSQPVAAPVPSATTAPSGGASEHDDDEHDDDEHDDDEHDDDEHDGDDEHDDGDDD